MTCVYNQNELCSKGDIRVGGSGAKSSMETCCESFKERGEGTMSNSTARKPSAAPSAVAAGNKYEKMRKSVLTTGWESAILQ